MKTYDPNDKYDVAEANRLGAPQWALDLLRMNPDYNSWGPGEDYMKSAPTDGKNGHGWDVGVEYPTWEENGFSQDDLNVVANFHFEVVRDSKTCEMCGGDGYHPDAFPIVNTFYGGYGAGWSANITLDELQALVNANRCWKWNPQTKRREPPTVTQEFLDEVNAANRRMGIGDLNHDGINRAILIRARCERLGIPTICTDCQGHGQTFTAPHPHVELVLWVLHPRKGCSRGVTIKNVTQKDLPYVFAYLRKARALMMDRFGKIPAAKKKTSP